jgi:hypothetical protein
MKGTFLSSLFHVAIDLLENQAIRKIGMSPFLGPGGGEGK